MRPSFGSSRSVSPFAARVVGSRPGGAKGWPGPAGSGALEGCVRASWPPWLRAAESLAFLVRLELRALFNKTGAFVPGADISLAVAQCPSEIGCGALVERCDQTGKVVSSAPNQDLPRRRCQHRGVEIELKLAGRDRQASEYFSSTIRNPAFCSFSRVAREGCSAAP